MALYKNTLYTHKKYDKNFDDSKVKKKDKMNKTKVSLKFLVFVIYARRSYRFQNSLLLLSR